MNAEFNKFFSYENLNNSDLGFININDSSKIQAKICYSPDKSGLYELNNLETEVNYKIVDDFKIGIKISSLNNDLFNLYKFSTGLKYNIDNIDLKTYLDFNQISVKNFKNEFNLSLGFAGNININNYNIGFILNNINTSKFSDSSLPNNNYINAYFNYALMDKLKIICGYFVEFSKQTSLNTGLEYQYEQIFSVYLGYNLNPKIYSFSFQLLPIKGFGLSLNFYNHYLIGLEQNYAIYCYF